MEHIPILRMGPFLLVKIQVDLHDRLTMKLQDDLTDRISQTGASGVLIDISALDVVDSFTGRKLAEIAGMSQVLDAETVVVGMRPAVAITLVELGFALPGVRTALDVERGMELLRASAGPRAREEEDGGVTDWHPRGPLLDRYRPGPSGREEPDCRAGLQPGRPDEDDHGRQRAGPQRARSRRRGTVTLETVVEGTRRGLRLTFEDHGPGIADINLAISWRSIAVRG